MRPCYQLMVEKRRARHARPMPARAPARSPGMHENRATARRLALAAALLAAGPAAAADVNTQILSGLTWRSGATGGGFPCLAQMRGRQLDANTIFIAPPSFAEMVQNTGSWVRSAAGKAP